MTRDLGEQNLILLEQGRRALHAHVESGDQELGEMDAPVKRRTITERVRAAIAWLRAKF